ncbi:hypothetical protein D3C71_1688040 [compost metagenome]
MLAGGRAGRLREHVQLARARHGAVAHRRKRRAGRGIQRFVWQTGRVIESPTHPQGQDDAIEMFAQRVDVLREREIGLCGSHLGTTHARIGPQVLEQQR